MAALTGRTRTGGLAQIQQHSRTLARPALLLQRSRCVQVPLAALSGAGHVSFQQGAAQATFRVSAVGDAAAGSASEPAPVPKKASKPRLPGLDSLRFFLIAYIGVGHFISFATRDAFLLKLFSQVNVWVGPFFVLSGYVAAYTATEIGKFEASPRIKPASAYTISRVAGYYPLYILVQILFGVMFAFADNAYNGPIATLAHGIMTCTLVQAWFPAHAEIWNAPTWFLSALTFSMVVLPHVLPAIAAMRKKGLKMLLGGLTLVSLISKLAYSYDLNCWGILEGICSAKSHPNILFWNVTRFNPFYNLLEVLMGVAACRLVMLDKVDDQGNSKQDTPAAGSALLPALGLIGITVARAAGYLTLNDPLTRCLLFVPLFIVMIMNIHRQTLTGAKGLTAILGHPLLCYLGAISFPIFILHGPIGQVFYKKIVATKLWGSVMPLSFFPAYCGVVLVAAALVQNAFVENKKVQEISGNITKSITNAVA